MRVAGTREFFDAPETQGWAVALRLAVDSGDIAVRRRVLAGFWHYVMSTNQLGPREAEELLWNRLDFLFLPHRRQTTVALSLPCDVHVGSTGGPCRSTTHRDVRDRMDGEVDSPTFVPGTGTVAVWQLWLNDVYL